MFKKMMLIAVSAAAFVAFAAQAAQGEVTDANGNEAETITAEGTSIVIGPVFGGWKCATDTLHLTKSDATTYHGVGTANGHFNEAPPHQKPSCTVNNIPLTVNSIVIDHIEFDGDGSGPLQFTRTVTYGHMLMCKDVGLGTIAYTPTATTFAFEGEMEGTENLGAGCPAASAISGQFHVFDENMEPAVIH
jgi:hypothetical protein